MKPIRTIIVGAGDGRGSWFAKELAGRPEYRIVALPDRWPIITA